MSIANQFDKPIDHHTWRAIRSAMLNRQTDEIDPEAIDRFMRLLAQPKRLADMLRRLHELRVLEQIIPAMKHARCLLQFNQYHKYTVDAHSIRAVECVTDLQDDESLLGILYRSLPDKRHSSFGTADSRSGQRLCRRSQRSGFTYRRRNGRPATTGPARKRNLDVSSAQAFADGQHGVSIGT